MPSFEGWDEVKFPTHPWIVYVIYFQKGDKEIPLYVGQTAMHIGRMRDYLAANFQSPTDFKVGEAVKYLIEKDYPVAMKYKESFEDEVKRKADEKKLIKKYKREGFVLLNDKKGYDYRKADKKIERKNICDFMDKTIQG